jgi:hypothetical protein
MLHPEKRDYGHQGVISPTFYEQFLLKNITKVQKDMGDLTVFLQFWGLCM